MSKGWTQFLLVAVPVLSLVGSWFALRAVSGHRKGRPADEDDQDRANNS